MFRRGAKVMVQALHLLIEPGQCLELRCGSIYQVYCRLRACKTPTPTRVWAA
jgi:hypothetical protein